MWVASKYGWFSIVKKKDGYHIRARNRLDLENLMKAVESNIRRIDESYKAGKSHKIQVWDKADYRFRVIDPQGTIIANVFKVLMQSITYNNFKDSLKKTPQEDKIPWYMRIWTTMHQYQTHLEQDSGQDTFEFEYDGYDEFLEYDYYNEE